jgi:hypothetical protein
MPWIPELFTAPALARIWDDERRRGLSLVPFYPGVLTGEIDALVGSYAEEPEVHQPVRGRIKGEAAFERFAAETQAWLHQRAAIVTDVGFVLTARRGVEETLLRLDGDDGPVELPVAIVSDHDDRRRITEQRIYFSSLPLTGRHAIRPPVLQPPDPEGEPESMREYRRELRAHYERTFSAGWGFQLECCALTIADRVAALEYNVVGCGGTPLPPQAGLAVFVRGADGKLAAARVYDDVEPPPAGRVA